MVFFRSCPVHWLNSEASGPLDSLTRLQFLSFRCTSWAGYCDCSLLCLDVEYLESLSGQSLSNWFCQLLASLLSCLPELSHSLTTLMSNVSTRYSVLVVEQPCVTLGRSTLLVQSELLAHSSLPHCTSAIMAEVASLLASRALHFTPRSRFAKTVSNQAINCFLAVSSCTLGSELHPHLGVLVTVKLPSPLQGQ